MISRRQLFKTLFGLGAGMLASRCVQPMPELALGDSVVAHTPQTVEKVRSTRITPTYEYLHSIKFNSPCVVNGSFVEAGRQFNLQPGNIEAVEVTQEIFHRHWKEWLHD